MGFNDAVLERSSPLDMCTELSKILCEHGNNSPIVMAYADGGSSHNVTFFSVQLSLTVLLLHLNLDLLEAVRTSPYHSWIKSCERVNCILNIGLQAVGLMRT